MNIHLLIHNLLYVFTVLLCFFVTTVIYVKAKKGVEKTTLILAFIGAVIFVSSHAVGVSVTDGELSRRILMFNLVNLFLPVFTSHCIFAFLGKLKEQKYFIILMYTISTSLFTFFILNPQYFLITSVPKMYFPNYYVAGPYYFLMLIYFFFLVVYSFVIMRRTYLTANNIDRNRIKYFAIAMFLAYLVGSIDFLLIYNIAVDPLWASLFIPLFTIPFTYAITHYELMDIRFVAEKAFIYVSISAGVGFILILLNYTNNLIVRNSPNFPSWASSVILAFIVTIGLIFFWRKIRETDFLKYEFIGIISHKFRTPLTVIKWSSESLMESAPENLKEDIRHIKKSADSLVDLTNILVNLSSTDEKNFEYNFVKLDLDKFIENLLLEYTERFKTKGITLVPLSHSTNYISGDEQKIRFVFQTLFDNAISYTKQGGQITYEILATNDKEVTVKITDTGIGIDENEIKLVFVKFYRTESSRKADTEGMGIGLYLSKKIMGKHDGKIWVESEGLGKGSSFFVSFPLRKK